MLTLQTGDRQTPGAGPEEESAGGVSSGSRNRWYTGSSDGRTGNGMAGVGLRTRGIRGDKALRQHQAWEQAGLFGLLPLLELVGRAAPTGEGLQAPGPGAAPGEWVTADAWPSG